LITPSPIVTFLGTGASGGTPGSGKSRRTESSVLVEDADTEVLIDVTGDFMEQAGRLDRSPDAILLTHAHRDASGGLAALRRWLGDSETSIPLFATAKAIEIVRARFSGLGHCDFHVFEPGDRRRIGDWTVTCHEVPHAARPDNYPTVAWKLTRTGHRLVYVSDVARPTAELREFSRDAGLLIVDGATHRRRIFTHLRIDHDLPEICDWPVERILLTQIGKSCPPHEELVDIVAGLCDRATPAYDGMEVAVPDGDAA